MRRTIVRYLNLGLVLTLRLTCLPVKKRFPTLEHLVEAGILEEKEKEVSQTQIEINLKIIMLYVKLVTISKHGTLTYFTFFKVPQSRIMEV